MPFKSFLKALQAFEGFSKHFFNRAGRLLFKYHAGHLRHFFTDYRSF